MTDLISKLADDLIALINASPRSPTKAEIKDVLRQHPNFTHPMMIAKQLETAVNEWSTSGPFEDLSEASLERAIATISEQYDLCTRQVEDSHLRLKARLRNASDRYWAESLNRPDDYRVSQEQLSKAVNAPECTKCGDHHEAGEICCADSGHEFNVNTDICNRCGMTGTMWVGGARRA